MQPKILFFDNHILVIEKPALLVTQPARNSKDSLEEEARKWLKHKLQKKGAVFLHAVYRLDKPASGMVLFAKTSKALSRLNQQTRNRQMKKTYVAEVEGVVKKQKGTVKSFLAHRSFRSEQVEKQNPKAKEAALVYEVIKRKENQTLLEVELITGRYHQIRSQLASIGHPIVGDKKYGAISYEKGAIHLSCTGLCFFHPITKKKMIFQIKPIF